MNTINTRRFLKRLDDLAAFGADPAGGWSRHSLSKSYVDAQQQVACWMAEAGLEVHVDNGGNLIGRWPGTDPSLPTIATGSHIDTVKCGGKYDGTLGVVGGLEAVEALREKNLPHPYTMEVISFVEEEGCVFSSSLFGSRILTGELTPTDLAQIKDVDGIPLPQRYQEALGLDIQDAGKAKRQKGDYRCFLELHIEQGAQLDAANKTIGVVQGIAGPHWFKILVTGRSDHAGATPMHLRKDALLAAASIIQAVNREVKAAGPYTVGTVGHLEVQPNGRTIIPGRVEMTVDVRDIDAQVREGAVTRIKEFAREFCGQADLDCQFEEIVAVAPMPTAPDLRELIGQTADELGYSRMDLISGAGHDCQIMGGITDVAMIFVPSKDGLSHCPQEYTSPEDLIAGVQVLADVLAKLQQT